jgi:hypothetical protein
MAIRIQNSTIIDDSRNIVDAGIGTFNNALNVGSAGTIFSATTRISSENVLSVRNSSNLPALDITGVGSMGVGIATPTRTLHVEGNGMVVSSGSTTVFSAETYSGSGNILSITGINNYPAMEVSGIGSVGVGTTVPRKSLHVEGNGVLFTNNNNTLLSVESFSEQSDKVLDIRDSSNNTILGVTTNVFSYSNPIQSVFSVESVSNSSSIFSVVNNANTSALEVTGIGSVGIGITTPTRALHVNGNGVVVSAGATSIFSIDTSNNSGSSFEVLNNSGGIAMQVTGIGSVGFGVSNPTRSLHVEGNGLLVSVGSTAVFSVDSAVGTSNIFEVLDPNNNVLLGISTVNVGVGTTNPTSKLQVTGDLTADDLRIQSVSEESTLINGNTITLNYGLGGGNIAICTNPSGPITLNVIEIPTNATFNNRLLKFSVFVNQGATGYACSTVNLNGVPETIRYPSGVIPTPSTNSIDIFNFIGINTVGSASSAANYLVLGLNDSNFRI